MGKSRIQMIEYERVYHEGLFESLVALFDERDFTEEEALAVINADSYCEKMVVVSKAQYETVFRSLISN